MFPVLQIGPLALQTPGLLLLIGIWAGLSLAERGVSRPGQVVRGLDANSLFNLALAVIISGVVGARLAYLLRYPAIFAQSPWSVFSLDPGLLDPWGGVTTGVVGALVLGSRKNLPFWPVLDAFTPALAVFMVFLNLSHLASGSGFGTPADLPWSIELWGMRRHPSQIYEALAALLILGVVWPGAMTDASQPGGKRFLTFLAWSAGARLFLEAFRGDSSLLPGNLRAAQVAAWLILAGCFFALQKIRISLPAREGG